MTKTVSNQSIEESFQQRTQGVEVIKDNKIEHYTFSILLKDQKPFEGIISREEMELILKLYTSKGFGLPTNAVAKEFPRYTLKELKRIIRAFNITKQSSVIPMHMLKEMTEQECMDYTYRIKSIAIEKKTEVNQNRENELTIKKLYLKNQQLQDTINSGDYIVKNIKKIKFPKSLTYVNAENKVELNGSNLNIYLSDMHIGAAVNGDASVYSNDYDENEVKRRLTLVLTKIYSIQDKFDTITVFNLGDSIDGFNAMTTRPSTNHILPQNMNNKEQIKTFINAMKYFFEQLRCLNSTSLINYVAVGESNHGGDPEWVANYALQNILTVYGVNSIISDKPINHIKIGEINYIYLHGKDNLNQTRNFPLVLDLKTENYFMEYVVRNKININEKIVIVKGDLHRSATSQGKLFTYKSVGSLFGSSAWIHSNFGDTKWACDYSLVSKKELLSGIITD